MKGIKQKIYETALQNKGKIMEYFMLLNRWQWLSEEEMTVLQNRRLSKLLLHAYLHVPYYRRILREAGVINKSEVNLNQFQNIAFLDKDRIRKNFEKMKSNNISKRQPYLNTSGGSTGVPVRFIQDKDYTDWCIAVKFLDDSWTDRTLCDKQIRLWGSERDLLVGRETLRTYFGRWLRNEKYLNSFRMTGEQMLNYVKTINKFKPSQILAYAESIYQLALFIERNNLSVYKPNAIMTSAGTLYTPMREKIENVFGAPVFNRYGSREVGDIACECERHQGLHVSSPTHYVEIIKPDGQPSMPGEAGEIVVTLLTNYSMPLIRYRIGDMGVWASEKCTCSRPYPLIKEVTGRVTDTFITQLGTQVHGEYFSHLFYFQNWIKKFQVIQEDYKKVKVLLVLTDPDKVTEHYEQKLEYIKNKIKFVMGAGCQVFFEIVDEIPASPSGKYRYTISKVAVIHFS